MCLPARTNVVSKIRVVFVVLLRLVCLPARTNVVSKIRVVFVVLLRLVCLPARTNVVSKIRFLCRASETCVLTRSYQWYRLCANLVAVRGLVC